MNDLIKRLRDYQLWMKDGKPWPDGDPRPSIGIEDIDGDETFGAAADAIERMTWNTDMEAANPVHGDVVIGYFPKGDKFHVGAMKWHDGENRWLYEEGESVWHLHPIKWMPLPEGDE